MSFSSNIKEELSRHFGNARHCHIAELAAILNMCGVIRYFGSHFCIKIQTENIAVARKCFTLFEKAFKIKCNVSVKGSAQQSKTKVYLLTITKPDETEKLLMATGILVLENGQKKVKNHIYSVVVNSICCRRAYIRGAFLAAGSLSDPNKTYHLEFVCNDWGYSQQLRDLINLFDMEAKIVERKEHFVVYLKDGEQIVDLLNIMEAHVGLMALENVRIFKGMRNNVNRRVNCETANLNKTVTASVKQSEDIAYIVKTIGLSKLPPQLAQTASLRLDYPDASLKELGAMVCPAVGKSGINHRLRKLSSIAQSIREGKGDFV